MLLVGDKPVGELFCLGRVGSTGLMSELNRSVQFGRSRPAKASAEKRLRRHNSR
jgi:hypothetical protein